VFWTDGLVLCPAADATCASGSLLVQVRHTENVEAGATYTETQMVTVPQVEPGEYVVRLAVDAFNQVFGESNDENNVRTVPFTVTAPDLIPTALRSPGDVIR
jgi:hypothetical protein